MASPAPITPRRRLPRALRIGLLVLAVVVALPVVVLPAVGWAFDLGAPVHRQLLALEPEWEKAIGRGIRIGAVRVRLFPTLVVAIRDVVVEAEPARAAAGGPSAEPLCAVGEMEVRVAVWPLLVSLGRTIKVSGVEVHAPALRIVRFADGRLSYEDILDRLAAEPPEPAKPIAPETLDYLGGIRLARAAITSASLRFTDLATGGAPASYAIDQLDLVARGVELGKPFPVAIDGAVLAPARNLRLALLVGPVARDLVIGSPLALLQRIELKLQPLEIEPLLRFVPPPAGLGLSRARVEADLAIELPASASRKVKIKGSFAARQLVLQGPAQGRRPPPLGQPTDVSVTADLTADPVAGDVDAPSFSVSSGPMSIAGRADVRSAFDRPQVRALDLRSSGITFERIAAVLPPGTLPQGAVLSGPIELHAAAAGTQENARVEAVFDLGSASIVLPGALRKLSGVALRSELRGRVQPSLIEVERLGLVLGTLAVATHGTIKPGGDFDLQLDAIDARIDPLLRLLPDVAAAIPAGATLAGDVKLAGHVRRSGPRLDGRLDARLANAAVKTSALELSGGAALSVVLRSAGDHDTFDGTLDLGPARILVPGSLDKAVGVPMRIAAGADRAGRHLTVREATVAMPGADLRAMGTSDSAAHHFDLRVTRCELDLARLTAVAPLLRQRDTVPPWLADARVHFTAALDGDPEKIGSLHARLDDLDLAAAGGHVRGSADVVGLGPAGRVKFNLAGTGIDFDRILGGRGARASARPGPRGERAGEPVVPRYLRTMALDGRIALDRGRVEGVEFANLAGEVSLVAGRGVLRTLRLDVLGGSISADGSTIDLNPDPPRFSLHARLRNVRVGQLVAIESPALGQHLDGHGNFDLDTNGQGLSWESIAPRVSGQVLLAFLDGRLVTPSIVGAALGQLFARVPGLGAPAQQGSELPLRNLSTKLQVQDGQLHTTSPIRMEAREGSLEVAGAIGLDQRLALTGSVSIPPATIAAASGGRLQLGAALPVSLKIGGTLTAPQVEVVDLGRTAAVLASSLLAGQGARALGSIVGGPLGEAAGQAAGRLLGAGSAGAAAGDAQKQLSADSQRRLQDEQARVQAQLQQRLQEEAQRRLQQEAQQRLQEEARKRLGRGLGGLFGN